MRPTSDYLLSLPEELLVRHILVRLDLLSLRACFSTCSQLRHTIKSSPLVNYDIELQQLSLIANPAVSYDQISINRRLEMLREYRERRVRWKASVRLLPKSRSYPWIKMEAGLLYDGPCYELEPQVLQWASLPSKEIQEIHWQWNTFSLSNPSAIVHAYALSIEENDLLALATWNEIPNAENSVKLHVQIHLIQHSTQLPYPGLSSPILDVGAFQRSNDNPVIAIAVRGANLAVKVGHSSRQRILFRDTLRAGHLSVWNWKTGVKMSEKLNLPDRFAGLVFLREDILLHGSSLNLTLDMYHTPTSTPSCAEDRELRLIERLSFPRLKTKHYDDPSFNIVMSFIDNPAVVPSFTESPNPKVTRLFAADNLSSILAIEVTIEDGDRWTPFLLITHHHTLLGRADRALPYIKHGATSIKWEIWGPDATRILGYHLQDDFQPHNFATCGSQFFRQVHNSIEVYDFGRASTNFGLKNISLMDSDQFDDPRFWNEWFQEVVHTTLPFAYQIFEGSTDGVDIGDWDEMYVDQSRIVGVLANERIDVLYIG